MPEKNERKASNNESKHFPLTPSPSGKALSLTINSDGTATLTASGTEMSPISICLGMETISEITHSFLEHLTHTFVCRACLRPEEDCSADPCPSVIADRGE